MATIDNSGADSVRLVSNERLDIPDFLAGTYGLNSEHLARTLSLWGGDTSASGPSQGCISEPTTSYDTGTKFLTINGFAFYQGGSAASPTAAGAGRVIAYDPTNPWQTGVTGVDLNSFSPSTSCIVWALPGPAQSSLETRKRWMPGASAETSFSTQVRDRVIVAEFQALPASFTAGVVTSFTSPPSDEWVAVLKIESWSASVPAVGVISVWDGTPDLSLVGVPATEMGDAQPTNSMATLTYLFRRGIAYLRDNTGDTNWRSNVTTYRGLKQLNEDTPVAALAAGLISDEGSGWTVNADAVGLTLDSVGGGGTSFTITHSLWVAGGARVAVAITPVTGGSNSSRNFTYSNDDSNTITVSWFNSTSGASAAVDAAGFSIVVYCVR